MSKKLSECKCQLSWVISYSFHPFTHPSIHHSSIHHPLIHPSSIIHPCAIHLFIHSSSIIFPSIIIVIHLSIHSSIHPFSMSLWRSLWGQGAGWSEPWPYSPALLKISYPPRSHRREREHHAGRTVLSLSTYLSSLSGVIIPSLHRAITKVR